MKKIISRVLIFCLVMSLSVICAGATQSKQQNFNKNYSLTGNQANDIASVAIAQIGKKGSSFGYTEHWCADFVSDCARLAGISTSVIPYTGVVANMYNAMISSGATKVTSPKKGDLVFYKNSSGWCHVAIMIDSSYSIHGNVNGSENNFIATSVVTKCTYGAYNNGSPVFVRPKYSGSNWYDSVVQADPGTNFSAYIIKNSTWKHTGHVNDNVELTGNTGKANEVWYFVRQSDKSYVIYNCDNNKVLTVKDSGTANDTNIIVADYKGTDNQKWYIHGRWSGEYVLRSKHSNKVFDVKTNYDSVGTNIHLWEYHGGTAQLFAIYKCDLIGTPELKVEVGSKVKFSWPVTQSAGSYTLKIYKNSTASGTPYLTKTVTGNSCELELGGGSYSAVLQAQNARASSNSAVKAFSVKGAADDGWTYASSLPSGVTSKNYTIQYCPVYEKTAKTSPGSGWVKGAAVKQVYENSGSVYYSTLPLTTSATRELVNYSYYHYCCGSKGEEVNYEYTSTYTHYDGINKDNVYEFYSHADYADSRYTFYGLKYKDTNAYVYCNSNTTCDGSNGTHGNRSYYYYKVYCYQDKVAVDYYKFTKQGEWSNKKDSSAASHTVRYKPIKKAACASGHSYSTSTAKATLNKNGSTVQKCKVCGATKTTTIYSPKTFTLSATKYTYNGKVKTPSVTVKDSKGKTLKKDTDYTVKYESGRKLPGKYTVTVTFKGKYSGTKKLNFNIIPEKIKKFTVSQTTDTVTVKWSKITGVDAYRVYKYNSKTKKYDKVKDVKGTSVKITGLKPGTVYNFKVRGYKKDEETIGGVHSDEIITATKCRKTSIKKITSSGKKINLTWSKISEATGYQVVYSTSKNFTESTTKKVNVKKASTVKATLKSLKKGKKYYVKVRAYKTADGKKIYGAYSAVKNIKVK